MKKIFLLFFQLLFCVSLLATQGPKGYLVTLNNGVLTGNIVAINPTGEKAKVVFVNDFGDIYPVHPALIKGFVYKRDSSVFVYESKKQDNEWQFMQVMVKGGDLNLYRTPDPIVQIISDGYQPRSYIYHQHYYWLESSNGTLIEMDRSGYKKKLRKLFKATAPELSDKIGSAGYRFQDLVQIVQEYNRTVSADKVVL